MNGAPARLAGPFGVTYICLEGMRILDDHLMRAVKTRAADTGRTMTAIAEESLRAALAASPAAQRRTSWDWFTVKGEMHSRAARRSGRARGSTISPPSKV